MEVGMAKERMISVDEAIINNTLSSEAVKIEKKLLKVFIKQ